MTECGDPARILVVCKRAPQQRDLLDRPYGRFHHLSVALAARSHRVRVLLPNVRRGPYQQRNFDGVDWCSLSIASDPLAALGWVRTEALTFKPDWVIGFSDTWCGWLAARAARHCQARLLIDAYDDYESYMPWNLPLHHLWRQAVRGADVVTAAGPQLAEKLGAVRPGRRPVDVLPMVADPAFRSMDRGSCRAALSLPPDVPLLGYFGGWGESRGTSLLLDAFREIRAARPDVRLVLSGRPPVEVTRQPGVTALGYLPDADLPTVLNAVDLACVISADTRFGRFSYPAKLCEAMACSVPVVATGTDPIRWMLNGNPECLAPVGDPQAFAARVLATLGTGRIDYGLRRQWTDIATSLDRLLQATASSHLTPPPTAP
jgi:glycosyltransferase involved in cell wall biosynthesis